MQSAAITNKVVIRSSHDNMLQYLLNVWDFGAKLDLCNIMTTHKKTNESYEMLG